MILTLNQVQVQKNLETIHLDKREKGIVGKRK